MVGWSDGGIVALLAAISHPGVITKVNRKQRRATIIYFINKVVAAAANYTIRPEEAHGE